MDPVDHHNLSEIESLNQRGGRTLSFVDLIRAGTMTEEMVAYCWAAIANGASFLTAARPGGAGKSTVLANLLALLPPGEGIETFLPAEDVRRAAPGEETARDRQCFLAHEIGSGHWYGYIWGDQVRDFINLKARGHRLAACLHADTPDELSHILCTPPLCCSSEEVRAFNLILFIHVLPQGRRVVAVHEVQGEAHRPVFEWHAAQKRPVLCTDTGAEYRVRLSAVHRLVAAGEARFEILRENVLAEYERQ